MFSINRTIIQGRATSEPRLKALAHDDLQLMEFSLAFDTPTEKTTKNPYGQRSNFIRVYKIGQDLAALLHRVHKGTFITVEGSLRYDAWETNDGQRHDRVSIKADNIFLPPRDAKRADQNFAQTLNQRNDDDEQATENDYLFLDIDQRFDE